MDTDLRKLAKAIRLGRRCARKIKQNVFLSLVTKLAVIVLTVMGHSILWVAILSDVGAMLLVTLNGMTILGRPRKEQPPACKRSEDLQGDEQGAYDREEKANNEVSATVFQGTVVAASDCSAC